MAKANKWGKVRSHLLEHKSIEVQEAPNLLYRLDVVMSAHSQVGAVQTLSGHIPIRIGNVRVVQPESDARNQVNLCFFPQFDRVRMWQKKKKRKKKRLTRPEQNSVSPYRTHWS